MRVLIVIIILLISSVSFSQKVVSGKVVDGTSGEPLSYVNIWSPDHSVSSSDSNGFFTIQIQDSINSLEFSYLSYSTKRIELNGKNNIEVEMFPSSFTLDELVVTAIGIKREATELGYSVEKLQEKDLSYVPTSNLLDNLSGKLAGIQVVGGATGIGSSSKITIRGESSFSNNNPLFVIDGIPINNSTIFNTTSEEAAGFQEIDFGNGAMNIHPQDIESVNVLKGPGASALYGARAANGVIIIETKSGQGRSDFSVSLTNSFSIERPFQLPRFQNQYGQGNSGEFRFEDGLGGGVNDLITYSWGPRLDEGILIEQFDSPVYLDDGTIVRGGDLALYTNEEITPTPFISHPDNLQNFYQYGFTNNNHIAISNSFERGAFRLAIGNTNNKSIIPGVNLDRNNITQNFTFMPFEKTTVSTSGSYIRTSSDNRPSNGYGSENVNYSLVAWGPRSLNIESLRDYWQPGLKNVEQFSFNYTYFDNPYFILHENRNSFVRDRLFGNIKISQELNEHFSISLLSGIDNSAELRKMRRAFSSNRFKNGAYGEHTVDFREVNHQFLINYRNNFQAIGLDVYAGANRMDQQAGTLQSTTLELAQPGIYSLNNAASPVQVDEYRFQKRINSVFGIAKLSWNNYLFLDVTARNDWSSALANPFTASNSSFFYPSASLSWILSRQFTLPQFLSYAKLRGSIAQVGNDTNPYQTSTAFEAQTPYNGQPTFGSQDFIANENLQPERTNAIEIGTDLRFVKDKIGVDITLYQANTSNQIIQLPLPISSGYSQQVVNGGTVQTRGIEIMLNGNLKVNNNLFWKSNIMFHRYSSQILDLPQSSGRLTLAYSRIYDSANQTVWFQVEEGGYIGDMYGTGYQKTEEGQFIVDGQGNLIADDELQKLGNYNPDFVIGWNNRIEYKNFNCSILLNWNQGGELVSRTLSLGAVGGQLEETAERPEEGFVIDGVVDVADEGDPVYIPNQKAISAESYYRQFYDRNHEINNVYDASFIKIRQASIGYLFKIKKKWPLEISIYGNNLFAWSEIPHFDPEQIAVQGNRLLQGVEDMSYATSKSFGIRTNVQF